MPGPSARIPSGESPPSYPDGGSDDGGSTAVLSDSLPPAASPSPAPEPRNRANDWRRFAEATGNLIKEAGFVLHSAKNLKLDVSIAGILKARGINLKEPGPQLTSPEREPRPERSSACTVEAEWICTMACADDLVEAVGAFRYWNRVCEMDATVVGTLGLHGIDVFARNRVANVAELPREDTGSPVMQEWSSNNDGNGFSSSPDEQCELPCNE